MKKMMALLLGCLLCLCAAGAMADELGTIEFLDDRTLLYDIYPNGYTKYYGGKTTFYPYEGAYFITGKISRNDTPLEFHANAYDETTRQAKTESGQYVSYDVTFDSLELFPSPWATAVRFGCDEGQATGCSITLKLRLSGTSEIWAYGHPAFQYNFQEESNTVKICVHKSSGTLELGAGGSSDILVGRNITLYANNKTITNKGTENQSNMTIDATISSPTNLIRVEGSPATCETDGSIAHWACPRCGGLFTDEEGLIDTTLSAVTIPALGHDLEKVPAKAPTCTADGNIEYYRCNRGGCGKLFTDADGKNETTLSAVTISALGHDLTLVPAKEPTYEQDGNIEHYRCKRCGALFSDANETQELTANDVVLAKLVRTDTLPQTGDSSRLTGWLALLGACCAGIWCLNRRRG